MKKKGGGEERKEENIYRFLRVNQKLILKPLYKLLIVDL